MGLRFGLARAVGAASTWALKNVFRRPAANFPGKIGLYADPRLIAHLRSRIREGIVVVVGTNGKTTVTNLLADAFEADGKTVACNRTGANLDSGIATALLHAAQVDWAVLESDELWLSRVAAQLQPDYIVLLNLFRDQLDRAGEIDHVQDSIVRALASSPESVLVYNADDPLCQAVADAVENAHSAFGIGDDLDLPRDSVVGGGVCQRCESSLVYEWRQYGHLGSYRCPQCGFAREEPKHCAADVRFDEAGVSFEVPFGSGAERAALPLPGAYMAYNLLAVCAAADFCGVRFASVGKAARGFAPLNGRLQSYEIGDRSVLLNLAKNPTGFNQNLRIVMEEQGPRAVAFFVNDKEADGHDVSWLWDVDFQVLAPTRDLAVFAGGIRGNDVQVRLKYAGVEAQLVDGARDFMDKAQAAQPGAKLFVVANYTALPGVKNELDRLQAEAGGAGSVESANASDERRHPKGIEPTESGSVDPEPATPEPKAEIDGENGAESVGDTSERASWENDAPLTRSLVIAHVYPELLNLYGDGGNVTVLADRARRHGLDVRVELVPHGRPIDLSDADIVFLGGGPDREQHVASISLLEQEEVLRTYVEDDGVLLAICGGFQIIGQEWLLGGESVVGLGLVDCTTKRAEGGSRNRLVGNVVLDSPLATMPVVGYENHAGRTYLGPGCEPFGRVVNKQGRGNNDTERVDGVRYRNVVGTYLHGPLLAKNPEVADWLIERALERRAARANREPAPLMPLDDSAERAANEAMRARL